MEGNRFYSKTVATLPAGLWTALDRLPLHQQDQAQEIRLRLAGPLSIVLGGVSYFVTGEGRVESSAGSGCITITQELLEETFLRLCGYSVHSHQQEIARGFITTRWGDRAGICASAVVDSDGSVRYRDVTSINLRISREVVGCAKTLLPLLRPREGVLIAGMPSSGKTTLLRDLVRAVASGEWGSCLKVAVVDERYELSACGQGIPLYSLGLCSDLICGLGKAVAIEQAVRTLSPDIIACDEIGSASEIQQLEAGLCSGVGFFATVHCGSTEELFRSSRVRRLMDTGAFGQLVLLKSAHCPGRAQQIYRAEDYYATACRATIAV